MGTCWRLTPHSSMWGCSAVRVSSSAFGRLRGNEMNGFLTSCYIHFKTFRENVDVMVFFFLLLLFFHHIQFTSVESLSPVQLFATPRTAARQASLSITNSRSLLRLMSTEPAMHINFMLSPWLLPWQAGQ